MEDRIRILIADANAEFSEQLAFALAEDENFEIVGTANGGMQAVELIRQEQPTVLIMDLMLKKQDGFCVLQRVQQMMPQPKVLVLTSFLTAYTENRAASLGVRHIMRKPCDFSAVAECVREMCAAHGRRPQLPAADPERTAATALHEIGVPPHIKGCRYLRKAITIAVNDMDAINAMTKELYPQVAAAYCTTPSRVERAIRNAVALTWERGSAQMLQYYFGSTVFAGGHKPTNSEFIAMVADRLRFLLREAEIG